MKRSCISSGWLRSLAFSNISIGGKSTCSSLLDDRLRTAFGHGFFCAPVVNMGLDVFLMVELFGEAEAIQRVYHRPARNHIGEAGIDLRMVRQRQRRITCVPRPKRTEHDLMAAAGIPEGSYSGLFR